MCHNHDRVSSVLAFGRASAVADLMECHGHDYTAATAIRPSVFRPSAEANAFKYKSCFPLWNLWHQHRTFLELWCNRDFIYRFSIDIKARYF